MAIAITPAQLEAICPESPVSAVVPINSILTRTASVTPQRAAMVIAQLAAASLSSRAPEQDEARWTSKPELVDVHNVEVTAWFWNAHRLHDLSDIGEVDGCTRGIVGAATEERLNLARVLYHRARRVLAGAHRLAA